MKRWRHLRYCCKAAKLSVEAVPLLTGKIVNQSKRHNPLALLPPFATRRRRWRRLRHCCKCTSTAATAHGQTHAAGLLRLSSERARRPCGYATISTRCTRLIPCAKSAMARCVHGVHGVHTCASSSFNAFPFSPSFMTLQAQQTTHFSFLAYFTHSLYLAHQQPSSHALSGVAWQKSYTHAHPEYLMPTHLVTCRLLFSYWHRLPFSYTRG